MFRYETILNLISSIFKLMRPKQWIKNLLVFAAVVFSKNIFELSIFVETTVGFIAFCMASSTVYILNDVIDRDKDRHHPKKCKRPIASGAISIFQAAVICVMLLLTSLFLSFQLSQDFMIVVVIYMIYNVLYSFKLKHIPIIDIMSISFGFVLRALAGAILVNVGISPWLIVCTTLLSLFLAIHKRRSELESVQNGNGTGRKVLDFYTPEMLRDMSSAIDSATIMSYCLYTFNSEAPIAMMCTIPFVIYGMFRYQLINHTKELAETPELALIQDKPLLINMFLWIGTCLWILYFM